MLMAPAGKPAPAASWATRKIDRQASSEGLTTQITARRQAAATQRPKICGWIVPGHDGPVTPCGSRQVSTLKPSW